MTYKVNILPTAIQDLNWLRKNDQMLTAMEYLNREIGKEGSPERGKFKEESYTYYLSEILKTSTLSRKRN